MFQVERTFVNSLGGSYCNPFDDNKAVRRSKRNQKGNTNTVDTANIGDTLELTEVCSKVLLALGLLE